MTAKTFLSRRQFLSLAGLTGAGLGLAACRTAPAPAPTSMAGMDTGGTPQGVSPGDMDAMHEAGVKAFVDGIAGNSKTFWPRPLGHTLDGDIKVFELTCTELDWEISPGKTVKAMAYNGTVPGPEIRVTEGDRVRVVVRNEMIQSTAVHFHGQYTPNAMDGVPFVTQPPIKPGETFSYEFVARPFGSHMYHSHHNAAEQVTKGLLGSFIVEPKDKSVEPAFDKEYTLILNDTGTGLTLNGKSFPATAPLMAKKGQKVRVRLMNEGLLDHPMHLHGMAMQVFAQDGYPNPAPHFCDTLNIAPGQRFDVLIDCQEPGVWAFHCHILTHAESPHGMFGMVTALIIE